VLKLNRPLGYFAVNRIAKKAMRATTAKAIHKNTRMM
jgi:hypothetical protein